MDLPFREAWAVDFEFIASRGDRPTPICMVAKELQSGRLIRLWQDELPSRPPFSIDEGALFISYMAAAELGCFLALGWPMPARILDLFAEFKLETNGFGFARHGLLVALSHYRLPSITKEEKTAGRDLVLKGGPWTSGERREIISYCQSDVDPLGPLSERMWPRLTQSPQRLGQALLRGNYMAAVARMEWTGVPIDTATLAQFREHWPGIKTALVETTDHRGVYEGTHFKRARFAALLEAEGILANWPLTPTGRLREDDDTFKEMVLTYPQLKPIRELRLTLDELKLEDLAVGKDGRNRAALYPFAASSGRNAPSASQFVFAPSTWIRGLIKPAPGRAVTYLDWSAQEIAIAAVLSGDAALQDAIASGDPYLSFAKQAGLAPPDATKQSHGPVRDLAKTCFLGIRYGMGAQTLARRTGISLLEANQLHSSMARMYRRASQWAENQPDIGYQRRELRTVFGWTLHVNGDSNPRTLRNFPCQANAAEMMRIGTILATKRGVEVCCPVHDALLIESSFDALEDTIATTRSAMTEASKAVLDGLEVKVEASIVRWPGRYMDPRGVEMWNRVLGIVETLKTPATPNTPGILNKPLITSPSLDRYLPYMGVS